MAAELSAPGATTAVQPAPTQQLQQAQQQAASSAHRILFLVVVSGADLDCLEDPKPTGPRYTRDSLRNLLQLLGCKPRLAYKVMLAVFQAVDQAVTTARQQRISRKTFQVHPHRNGKVYVSLTRADFMSLVSTCAAQYSYKISPSSEELKVACSLRERRRCIVVLLCGTSGSGKSTLASILASRLGITTVVSTDSIRHMLRSFISRESSPLLWASTYQAGEHVGNNAKLQESSSEGERALYGYKAQCKLLSEHLELLIAGCEARTQSLICEGVHLNISTVVKLMSRHPNVLPFLVYIPSESRHVERMAVRAKYMTLDPNKNRYVRYMGNIRLIQEYLVRKADKYCVPRVDNSNVDRSVGIIHLTVMSCLRRMARGEPVLDPSTGRTSMLAAEYAAVLDHLQGEKDRLAAATAAAAAVGAGADAAAGASSGSSFVGQPALQQHQQQPLRDGGGSGVVDAESLRSSGNKQPVRPAQAAQSIQPAAERRITPASSDSTAVDGTQKDTAKISSTAATADGLNSFHLCSQEGDAVQADTSSLPDGAGGSHMGVGPGSPERSSGTHVPAAAVAAGRTAPSSTVSSRGPSSTYASSRCSADDAAADTTMPRTVAVFYAATSAAGPESQGRPQQLLQMPGVNAPANSASEPQPSADLGAQQWQVANACIHQLKQQQQQQPQGYEEPVTQWTPFGTVNRGSRGTGRGSTDSLAAENSQRVSEGQGGSSSRGSRDVDYRGSQHSTVGEAAAGSSNSTRSSCEHRQQDEGQQQQQQLWRAGVHQQRQQQDEVQADDDFEDMVSSGEELDGLGELGSSDNEGERFLQEYGSVYESTTCDEHDDFDEAGGLRAWNAGMATALWPSYAHVYAPNAAAAASSSNGLAGTSTGNRLMVSAAGAGGVRALRPTVSEISGPAADGAGGASSSSSGGPGVPSGADTALQHAAPTGSGALMRLAPRGAAAALSAGRTHTLPTVYESQQPPQGWQQQQPQQQALLQQGTGALGRPPLPASHAGGGEGVLSPRSSSGAHSAASAGAHGVSSSRVGIGAVGRGAFGRHVRRSKSSSGSGLHPHTGRQRPASGAGSNSSMLRQWSADVDVNRRLEPPLNGVLHQNDSTVTGPGTAAVLDRDNVTAEPAAEAEVADEQ